MFKINQAISVPKDLSTVTSFNPEDEVSPESVGMTQQGVELIWKAVENLYRTGLQPSIALCIRRHGKVVINRAIGYAQGSGPYDSPEHPKVPATPQTPYCLFSASKAITAILIHILDEKNLLHLMDPVSYYLPDFSGYGKRNTTLYQILSHRGGIPVIDAQMEYDLMFDNEKIVKLLCRSKSMSPDGRTLAYHALTAGYILGEIVRKVTGKGIKEVLAEYIRTPMDFKYLDFGITEDSFDKIAHNHYMGTPGPAVFPLTKSLEKAIGGPLEEAVEASNSYRFLEAVIPAGNIYATAEEASRFFQLLLNKGQWKGTRIMEPMTVQHAIMETGAPEFDRTLLMYMRYSTGMMLGHDPIGIFGPYTGKAFGHMGFTNTLCWADPARDISVAFLNTGKLLVGKHLVPIFKLLTEISQSCPRRAKGSKKRRGYENETP